MKTFTTYKSYRGAVKVRAYFRANGIAFNEWRDKDGGYEFLATVTPEQYSELENI